MVQAGHPSWCSLAGLLIDKRMRWSLTGNGEPSPPTTPVLLSHSMLSRRILLLSCGLPQLSTLFHKYGDVFWADSCGRDKVVSF